MHKRIPQIVQPILEKYIRLIENQLPGFIGGFYIYGSIALDAFNEKFSDIDFITVVNHKVMSDELKRLGNIHKKIRQEHPEHKLEGSYLQWSDLGHFQEEIEPYPYYYQNALHPYGYHELNSVTWWVLKHRGVALIGPEPEQLNFTVDWNLLITRMRENLNSYWASWISSPVKIAYLLTDTGIQWAVLGVLRQFYTFKKNSITSKTAAGEYALSQLPEKWHQLIQEAINIRAGNHRSYYTFKAVRAIEAISLLKYIIRSC
ncbi:MAG: aminoglycoside adenylyltransferase domain-containing protein [Acidobacteriota bacterium]